MKSVIKYSRVAVSGPLRKSFTYRLPDHLGSVAPGQRLLIPFGRRQKIGFYLGDSTPPKGVSIKNILKIPDGESYFPKELFKLCTWMADYYFANPADCLAAALPPPLKTSMRTRYAWTSFQPDYLPDSVASKYHPERKLTDATTARLAESKLLARLLADGAIVEDWSADTAMEKRPTRGYAAADRDVWEAHFAARPFSPDYFEGIRSRVELKDNGWSDYRIRKACDSELLKIVAADDPIVLDFIRPRKDVLKLGANDEQQAAIDSVGAALKDGFKPFLLHGITGSGKTLVYCHICREVLASGRTALMLTPEIALTGSTLSYFRAFFGDDVTVIHSAMTDRERIESWRGIRSGKYKIVVGPRSALFAPLPDLGLIIVDEEHDSSYKQTNPAPRFHGRDSAIMRAKINKIPVLLGSASPSLESYQHAREGRYTLLQLKERPAGAVLPDVRIVDMRKDRIRGDMQFLSYPLKLEIDRRLEEDQQAILYLNRRGHSPMLKCAECGHTPECSECQVKLTYHRVGNKLTCHYCGLTSAAHDLCSKCGGHDFIFLGVGTQKVEQLIPRLFDSALVARFDSDSARGRKQAHSILASFAEGKQNLLIGTQMVTKGLDLPNVTLVGVLSADSAMDLPDFRASEKAFSRLLQVAGRSGRAANKGEVLIQTFCPENEIIAQAARQDYVAFYESEIVSRHDLEYPPFSRMINFVLTSADEDKLQKATDTFRSALRDLIKTNGVKADLLGPAKCPLYFLRKQYRRHLFIKTKQVVKIGELLTQWEERSPRFGLAATVKIAVDVDPQDMM